MDLPVAAWTFSTLGCPDLSLEEACALANRWGATSLELRCLGGRIDLPAYFKETFGSPARIVEILAAHEQQICLLDTSFELIPSRPDQADELLRFVPWAEALLVPFLRVFDGGVRGEGLSPENAARAVETVRWWQNLQRRSGLEVDIVMETHAACLIGADCLAIQQQLDEPLAVLWDTHHTWRAGEPVAETWRALAPYVRHVHVKDSVTDALPTKDGYHYTLPGRGEFPWAELRAAWERTPCDGVVSLEWERRWHPALPPIEEALAAARTAGWL